MLVALILSLPVALGGESAGGESTGIAVISAVWSLLACSQK